MNKLPTPFLYESHTSSHSSKPTYIYGLNVITSLNILRIILLRWSLQ